MTNAELNENIWTSWFFYFAWTTQHYAAEKNADRWTAEFILNLWVSVVLKSSSSLIPVPNAEEFF